jgi:hypothetical protein
MDLDISMKQHVAAERWLPFECVALVLQGGGALGAYQAGVYEAFAEANIHPDWVSGTQHRSFQVFSGLAKALTDFRA